MSNKVLVMAGGTGGHVFPALACARMLRDQGYEVHWLGTRRGIEVDLVPQAQLDDEQLANTLINYMNNSELLQQMAERAREQATPNATADVVRACLEVAREH